jgi:serine protease Do
MMSSRVTTNNKLGPSLAFAVALTAGLGLWPAGCAHHSPMAPGAETAAGGHKNVPASFLPNPAFAYASEPSEKGKVVSLADVAAKALPSVVNIASTKVEHFNPRQSPFFTDPFFQRFFGGGPWEVPRERREEALGSGVIVSKDGIVLTNNHVISGAQEIKVFTSDKREFDAKVIGADPKSDLAVIRLKGDVSGLKPIQFGDSSRLRLGDVVLAIGDPFGVGQTVTMGIVSAKGRANVGIEDYEDFIQTDAAINPGNSGGALVDMDGDLVGINTAILSRSGGYQGIGFAIPTNMVKPIMDELIKTGKVVRGWLGVSIQDIDQSLAKALSLPNANGVLISDVGPNSPAEKAGLKRGDVVLKVNGTAVNSTGELRNLIADAGANVDVKLDLLRAGKSLTINAKLGEMPASMGGPSSSASSSPSAQPSSLDGLTLQNLNASNRQRFRVSSDVKHGALVTQIEPGSNAAQQGLRPGDVLLQVNRHDVNSVQIFKQLYGHAKGNVLLLVSRQGRTFYLVVHR